MHAALDANARPHARDVTAGRHKALLSAMQRIGHANPRIVNRGLTFVYGSGAGADSSETSRTMWARVRGRTENALFKLPFKTVCALRPGIIQPLHGARSKTTSYRLFYQLLGPLMPLARWLAPRSVLSTEIIAQAMLNIARRGAARPVLETADIWAAAHPL